MCPSLLLSADMHQHCRHQLNASNTGIEISSIMTSATHLLSMLHLPLCYSCISSMQSRVLATVYRGDCSISCPSCSLASALPGR